MSFDLTPTGAQHDLARRTHEFSESVIRPVAADYDARQEFPVNYMDGLALGEPERSAMR